MRPGVLLRRFTSAGATVTLLCLLAALMLMHVVLPQQATLGQEQYEQLVESRPWARLLLETLGFGSVATSGPFLFVLGLFLLNLALVVLARVGPTWQRIALRPRSEQTIRSWIGREPGRSAPLPASWRVGEAVRGLRAFGYQVRRVGDRTVWGVKHRMAPLGFLLFHLSFFLLGVAGVSIYYTRFVGSAVLSEGQEFTGDYGEILRRPPLGGAPELSFLVDRVDPRFEAEEPVHLGATFRFDRSGVSIERRARVNHPAQWSGSSILVDRAGLSPVLWLQDERGFTLDRVAAPVRTRGGGPTDVDLEGDFRVEIHPLAPGRRFPSRSELADHPLRFQVARRGESLFDGFLRPGEAATFVGGRLVHVELRYWVGIRVISERGGAVLVIGFAIGTVGLVWRLLLYHREVALGWDETELRVVGRSEYFSRRFDQELDAILLTLASERSGEDRSSGSKKEG